MPADVRKLAQEAVELSSGESLSWDALDCEFPGDVVITYPDGHTETFYAWEHARFIAHAGTHYATLARALIEALDERDHWRAEATRRAGGAHAAVLDRLEMERGMLRARADIDAILAALPHALGSCGCEVGYGYVPGTEVSGPGVEGGVVEEVWPEQHEAAIEWLRGRCP